VSGQSSTFLDHTRLSRSWDSFSWGGICLHRPQGTRKVNDGSASRSTDSANLLSLSVAPTVIEKLPGQTPGRAKIPSVLLYDKKYVFLLGKIAIPADKIDICFFRSGICQDKWGTQVSKLSKDERKDLSSGALQKVEWFKSKHVFRCLQGDNDHEATISFRQSTSTLNSEVMRKRSRESLRRNCQQTRKRSKSGGNFCRN
jgi:hypothetical protein